MRRIEIVLLVALAAATLIQLAGGRLPWRAGRSWAAVLVAVLILHLLVEGPRIPMAGAYLLTGLIAIGAVMAPARKPGHGGGGRLRALGRVVVSLGLLALAATPAWLLPVIQLPAPGGPHRVGSTSFALSDPARSELFGPDPGGPRSIMVRAWYPARAGASGPLAPYALHRAELAGGILGLIRLAPLVGGQLDYVRTHSILDAPLATPEGSGWPVLVFSHGYTGFSAQNTPQMEDLASRGYVVFSISHTHDAGGTVFPDGRVVGLDPTILAMFGDLARFQDSVKAALEGLRAATTPEERQAAFRVYARHNLPRIEASVPVWAGDTRFVLDHLERLEAGAPGGQFAGALDLDRVGVFGMSFGGSNAGEVCRQDRRCKAGVNMDGQQFGPLVLQDSLTMPFMILASSTALPIHRVTFDRLRGPGYLIELRGSEHLGLTDTPLVAPWLLRWMGLTGTMSPARLQALMTEYLGAFFDLYLRGQPAPVLTAPTPRDDVGFEANPAAAVGQGRAGANGASG